MATIEYQIEEIKKIVSLGGIRDAIDKLQQLAKNSESFSNILNDAIMQSSRLSRVEQNMLSGTIKYEESTIAHNQIVQSILSITTELQEQVKGKEHIEDEVNVSIQKLYDIEVSRKFGISKETLQTIQSFKKKHKIHHCLWIDDAPNNDVIELQLLSIIGIENRTAKDPYTAYKTLKDTKIDIIIINSLKRLKDSPQEGIQFCEYLFTLPQFKNIPIILHSISFQDAIDNEKDKEIRQAIIAQLPKNIKNRF